MHEFFFGLAHLVRLFQVDGLMKRPFTPRGLLKKRGFLAIETTAKRVVVPIIYTGIR